LPETPCFAPAQAGENVRMIGLALALIVIGVVFGFFLPFGWIIGAVGLVLAALYLAGFGRRAARGDAPTQPGP
jgi:hypothetical protein